jgi:hypothetical protein
MIQDNLTIGQFNKLIYYCNLPQNINKLDRLPNAKSLINSVAEVSFTIQRCLVNYSCKNILRDWSKI